MNTRSDQQKKRMGEKRRGIGFETVAGMGGGYDNRRNTQKLESRGRVE